MKKQHNTTHLVTAKLLHLGGLFGLVFAVACLFAKPALAVNVLGNECTYNQVFNLQAAKLMPTLQAVISLIDGAVQVAMENLYNGIVGSDGYAEALGAAVTVYIIFYAIAFMFGIAQVTMAQLVIRVMKIAIVFALIGPLGEDLYVDTIVTLFRDGGEYMVTQVATLTPPTSANWATVSLGNIQFGFGGGGFTLGITNGVAAPLLVFQGVINAALSPRMFILIFAAFGSGPFGVPMGLFMMWAVFEMLGMIVKAMEVYGLSIVVKAILLGLGPIFIVFILFDRTMPLFKGWINQLVSFTLQPVFMFAFLAFYLGMLESAIWDMVPDVPHAVMNGVFPVEACYNSAGETQNGQYNMQSWRFNLLGVYPWQGQYNFKGPVGALGEIANLINLPIPLVFPISIISTLIVLLFSYIGKQLIASSTALANDIANGFVNLAGSAGSEAKEMVTDQLNR